MKILSFSSLVLLALVASSFFDAAKASSLADVESDKDMLSAIKEFVDQETSGKSLEKDSIKRRLSIGRHLKSFFDKHKDSGTALRASKDDFDLPSKSNSNQEKETSSVGKSLRHSSLANTKSSPKNDLSTSFLSSVELPARLKSFLEKKVTPESLFLDSTYLEYEAGLVDSSTSEIESDRQLGAAARPECATTDSGAKVCVIANYPFTGFATILGCPQSATNVGHCVSCIIVHVRGDPTPDDLTDNAMCDCTVCSSTDPGVVKSDCSGITDTGCVHLDCNENCSTSPPGSGGGVPATTSPPGGGVPATTPDPSPSLPSDCFKTAAGNVGCLLVNEPDADMVTIFTGCPEQGLTGPSDCGKCVILGPDATETPLDNPRCGSCQPCAAGGLRPFRHDCRTLIDSTSSSVCPVTDCNGCIDSSLAPIPDDCLTTSSGAVICAIQDSRAPGEDFLPVFLGCPQPGTDLKGPRDCPSCQVIILADDRTPETYADNESCKSCNVCADGTVEYSYDCSGAMPAEPECPSADCNGNCVSGSGGANPTSHPFCTDTCITKGNVARSSPSDACLCCCNNAGCSRTCSQFQCFTLCN